MSLKSIRRIEIQNSEIMSEGMKLQSVALST